MLDNNNRKKSLLAYARIELVFWRNLLVFFISALSLGVLLSEQDLLVFLVFSGPILLLAVFLGYRSHQVTKATDYIRDYGPLLINHPEYTLNDLSKAVKKDRETVTSEFEFMLKKKLLYGNLDLLNNKFTMADDYSLRYLLTKKRWNSAI
jgi:hypothetical protein